MKPVANPRRGRHAIGAEAEWQRQAPLALCGARRPDPKGIAQVIVLNTRNTLPVSISGTRINRSIVVLKSILCEVRKFKILSVFLVGKMPITVRWDAGIADRLVGS